jgi:hypothetical protein
MAVVNIFTRKAPTLSGVEFDAVLEDDFEASVDITSYPLESGVQVSDHRILNPMVWRMVGAVSNNPLRVMNTDFFGGVVSNLTDSRTAAFLAGLSSGWLAGSDETRSSTTLQFLLNLMRFGEPFTVDAGDITLSNMVITRLSRTKDAENENGLIFVAELQELILLDRIAFVGAPAPAQLRDGDPSKSAAVRLADRGQMLLKDATNKVTEQVNNVLDGIYNAIR